MAVVERAREQRLDLRIPCPRSSAVRSGPNPTTTVRASKPASASRRTCTPFCSISFPKYTTTGSAVARKPANRSALPSSGRRSSALPGFGGSSRASSTSASRARVRGSGTQASTSTPGGISNDAVRVAAHLLEDGADVRGADERGAGGARASAPQAESAALPRIEYSSSEPCALTANGAPAAAPTGPPRRTWFVKTTSAGNRSRSAEAFASTQASSSARCSPAAGAPRTPRSGRARRRAAAPDVGPQRQGGAQVVARRGGLLGQHRHVVAGEAPLAGEHPGVDVRARAAEQVAVPEEDAHRARPYPTSGESLARLPERLRAAAAVRSGGSTSA